MAKRQKASVSPLLANPVPGRSIEEHGIVGNLETAALVALDGTIDFMCWPNFDSPTVFAALLDPECESALRIDPAALHHFNVLSRRSALRPHAE
jgi:GH15 family glucan-1,4-alpha-glucosidase